MDALVLKLRRRCAGPSRCLRQDGSSNLPLDFLFALLTPIHTRSPFVWIDRQLVGSHAVATETVKVLRDVVAASRVSSFDALLEAVNDVGRRLAEAGKKGMLNETAMNSEVCRSVY